MYKLFFGNVTPYYDEKTFNDNYAQAGGYRKEKIDALSDQKEKARCLTAGLLFEEACKAYGLDMIVGQVEDDENGNPRFKCADDMFPGGKRMYFSISYSEDYVLVGISDGEIGVNIQHITEPVSGIADKYFSEKEQDLYFKANDDEYKETFYRLWALKASYMTFMGNIDEAALKEMSVISHMQDCGVWHEEYIYAVTTQDYKAVDEAFEAAQKQSVEKTVKELHKASEKANQAEKAPEVKKTVAATTASASSETKSSSVEIKNTSNSVVLGASGEKLGSGNSENKVTIENKSSGTVIKAFDVKENKKEEVKVEESKAEEPKTEEAKAEEVKAEEPKTEEVKAEEVKAEEPKTEEAKAEEPKEEVKTEEPKTEEVKAEETSSPRIAVVSKVPEKKHHLRDILLVNSEAADSYSRQLDARTKRGFRDRFKN